MAKVIKIVKEKWLVLVLLSLGLVLLLIKILSTTREEPAIIPGQKELLPKPVSQFGPTLTTQTKYQIVFDKNAFSLLPKQLPVYRMKKLSEKEVLTLRSPVITSLGFLGRPTKKTVRQQTRLIWEEKNNLLDLVVETGQFRFSGQKILEWPNGFTLETFPEKLKEILVRWKLITPEATSESIQSFQRSGQQLVAETNPNLATVFQAVFQVKIADLSLIGLGPTQNLVEIKIDREGKLLSLNFLIPKIETEEKTYLIKTYAAVSEEIEKGNLYLFQVTDQSGQPRSFPPISQISQISLNSVSLAYLITPEIQDYLQPVFVFSGTILFEGQLLLAKFYLPAI